MLETRVDTAADDGDAVRFAEAGSSVRGSYHCADCGYGVTVQTRLPACPMCGGRIWQAASWPAEARVL